MRFPRRHSLAPLLSRFAVQRALPWLLFAVVPILAAASEHDSDGAGGDPVARLQQRLDAGKADLPRDDRRGYLDAVLRELKLPVSSQTLVFTKTSLQRDQISPATPRALYFNDDTYVGYAQGGNVLEIATVDPKRGTVFYSLDQFADRPAFRVETDSCLNCHDSAMTRYTPGLLLRSVTSDPEGFPLLAEGTTHVTQETPFGQRWGGWYVTGTHGRQRHMGNTVTKADNAGQPVAPPAGEARLPGENVTDLTPYCDVSRYPSRHSDIVALMVLGHQTEMHNRMARAKAAVEQALRDERAINEATGTSLGNGQHSESTTRRIQSAAEPLLKYMLFCDEPRLTDPVKGTTDFAKEFAAQGPRDKQGRSLRDLDLTTRLFKFPCSYLIYSEQWDALPPELLEYCYRRLWLISHEKEKGSDYDHLTTDDRDAIREILLETKRGLPEYWKQPRK